MFENTTKFTFLFEFPEPGFLNLFLNLKNLYIHTVVLLNSLTCSLTFNSFQCFVIPRKTNLIAITYFLHR